MATGTSPPVRVRFVLGGKTLGVVSIPTSKSSISAKPSPAAGVEAKPSPAPKTSSCCLGKGKLPKQVR